MIEIGHAYRDKITGFKGVCTAYVEYISGCNQALIQPECGEDGAFRDAFWLDVQRLVHIPGTVVKLDNGATPGFGPTPPIR